MHVMNLNKVHVVHVLYVLSPDQAHAMHVLNVGQFKMHVLNSYCGCSEDVRRALLVGVKVFCVN